MFGKVASHCISLVPYSSVTRKSSLHGPATAVPKSVFNVHLKVCIMNLILARDCALQCGIDNTVTSSYYNQLVSPSLALV